MKRSYSFRKRLFAGFLIVSLVPLLICSAMLLQIFRLRMTSSADTQSEQALDESILALDKLDAGIRGAVQALCAQEGVSVTVVPGGDCYYHPGRSARLMHGETVIATLGQVHPDIAQAMDLPEITLLAEVDMVALYACAQPMGQVKPISRMQAVSRDIALVMPDAQPLGPVMDAIRHAAGEWLEDIRLFDVFRGVQVGLGMKSAAFSLTFRAPDQTLTEDHLAPVMKKVMKVCREKFGAEIRS